MVSVLFALLTALCNGTASVLQRIAAAAAPPASALHLSLFNYLIRRKVWLAGIGMVTCAAVCQAAALATRATTPQARTHPSGLGMSSRQSFHVASSEGANAEAKLGHAIEATNWLAKTERHPDVQISGTYSVLVMATTAQPLSTRSFDGNARPRGGCALSSRAIHVQIIATP